jgi:hypothetical protein
MDISIQQPKKLNLNARQEIADLIERVTKLDKLVKQNIDDSKLQMKAYYDVYIIEFILLQLIIKSAI